MLGCMSGLLPDMHCSVALPFMILSYPPACFAMTRASQIRVLPTLSR